MAIDEKPVEKDKPFERAGEIGESTVKIDRETFDELRKKGKKVYLIQFEIKEESLGGKNPLDFFNEIEKTGDILVRNVDMELVLKDDSFTGEGIPLSILYATALEKDLVAHIFGIREEVVKEVKPGSSIEEEVIENVLTKKKGMQVDSFFAQKQMQRAAVDEGLRLKPGKGSRPGPVEEEDTGQHPEPGEEPGEPGIIEIEEEEEQEDTDAIKDVNRYLTFWLGDKEYGIVNTRVHEIITLKVKEITPIPGAEDFTRGIINWRGNIIPVYDFRLRLKFEEKAYDERTVILIVMIGNKTVGVIVDRVIEEMQLSREQITKAPPMQQIPANFVIGIGQKDGRFIILLKLKEIFSINGRTD
ncbi:MAG: chemotaxis protein CheW [Candidatus Aminicenantes bacterium]|nr:MAG: chemotaxis protein CheW [Candidatus Aminicenantes bacterium]